MAGSVRPNRDETIHPVTDLSRFETGWLSTDGQFYACEYEQHMDLAWALGFLDDFKASQAGWIHVALGQFHEPYVNFPRINQKQVDAIFDWTQAKKGRQMPEWIDSL